MFSSSDTIWVLIAAALVFFMQAGFAMVETGFTRAKNAGNIIMKNMIDLCLGTIVFWVIGFGIMFGGSGGFAGFDAFMQKDYVEILGLSFPPAAFFIFQTVFCATAATIVSGAMAERTKFTSYIIYSLIISAIVYPVSGHWIWGGGWLAELGFHDFAGSTAVHMVGGVAALVGAKMVGPRIGKYSTTGKLGRFTKLGKAKAIPGHSLTLGALGVFILWFCWFGFNGGSTTSMTGDDSLITASNAFYNTNMAAATAAITVMVITWIKYKKPDVSMTLNGALAGLVAITAGADVVNPVGAFVIGLLAAFVVVFGVEFIDKVLKIDDPVGAIGVHGLCGAFGTLMVGLFDTQNGAFYGGGGYLFGVQLLGVISVIAWVGGTMFVVFFLIKKTVGLRVKPAHELAGLDKTEHGLSSSYADFMIASDPSLEGEISLPQAEAIYEANKEQNNEDVKIIDMSAVKDAKMSKVVILTSQPRFQALKNAMDGLGITGMTVTNVLGCGMQRGGTEYYRGAPVESTLLPKIKVEIVVCKVPVSEVVEAAKQALYTGNIGDGKIFIYDVENVIKVRTGGEGYDALQDE